MGTEANSSTAVHVILVSFPAQGHINPMLRLGKLLADKGLLVTLITTRHVSKLIRFAAGVPDGEPVPVAGGVGSIRFQYFSDGFSGDEERFGAGIGGYMPHLELAGRKSLPGIISAQTDKVSCMVSNPFIPWVGDVAAELGIPCATLWVQSRALFSCYYHYHRKTLPFPVEPGSTVALPGLPVLLHDEIPTFLNPKSPFTSLGEAILGQFGKLESSFCVLADTFEELESDHVTMSGVVKPIGPLFLLSAETKKTEEEDPEGCLAWLDERERGSVVYISFGTIVQLSQEEVEEIARGVLSSGVPFLWSMRGKAKLPEGIFSERGKVVTWSPQEAVLGHVAVGLFLTHCGWNSAVEALGCGVPVVALPQWGDQVTNAKFLVEVFGVGVRLGRGEIDGHVAGREEVERCLREGMGNGEIRRNSLKWKEAAAAAVDGGGSSHRNLTEFVEEVKRRSASSGGGGDI